MMSGSGESDREEKELSEIIESTCSVVCKETT